MERQSTKAWGTVLQTVARRLSKKSVGTLLAVGVLASCSVHDSEIPETGEVIGFQATAAAVTSRSAQETTADNLKDQSFEVFAFADDGKPFIGRTFSEGQHTCSEGVEIRHDGQGWDYADPSDKAYWPTGSLDFFAFHPKLKDIPGYSLQVSAPDKQTLRYALPLVPEKQYDILYAIQRRVSRDTHQGKAPLHFRHALSQVSLKVRTEMPNMEIDVEDIKIHNLAINGVLTLPAGADVITQADWEPQLKVSLGYEPKRLAETVRNIGADPVQVSQQLYVPQVLTAWNPQQQSVAQADADLVSYISVLCRIRQRGVYVFGDAQHCQRMFIPFAASWEPGKRYVYTFTFGGGYDENGQRLMAPVGFQVDETAWDAEETSVPAVSLQP